MIEPAYFCICYILECFLVCLTLLPECCVVSFPNCIVFHVVISGLLLAHACR